MYAANTDMFFFFLIIIPSEIQLKILRKNCGPKFKHNATLKSQSRFPVKTLRVHFNEENRIMAVVAGVKGGR